MQGQQGVAGQNNVNWQGTWNAATVYAVNDAVFYLGSSYRSLVVSNTNFQPDISSAQWTLFAAGGGTGNATLTSGGTLAATANSVTNYIFGNTNNGVGSGSNTRSIGLWGRIGSNFSGTLPLSTTVPNTVGVQSNFAIGTVATATGANVGLVGSVGSGGAVGVWGHNDNSTANGTNWNVGVIGTSAGTNNAATGVYGQGNRGVSGSSSLVASGSNNTQANRLQGGGVFGSTSSTNGNAGFFLGRVVIENTAAGGAATSATDPFIVWCQSNGAAGINSSAQMFANSFNPTSDRNRKENFEVVDTQDVLRKVIQLPVTTWNFIGTDKSIRSMGPMAQDFHAAFGLNGAEDKRVNLTDLNGVALAAIKGLNMKLEGEVKARDAKITDLETRMAAMEKLMMERSSPTLAGAGIGFGVVAGPIAFVGLMIGLKRRRKVAGGAVAAGNGETK